MKTIKLHIKVSLIFIFLLAYKLPAYAQDLSIQTGHSSTINDLKFTSHDRYLISCGNDNKVIIWDMNSFMQMKLLIGHNAPVNAISINPKSYTFATAGDDKTIKIWNYPQGDLLKEYKFTKPVKGLDYSPDGKTLVCATDSIIFIDLTTNERTRLNIKARKTFSDVKYSPNGTYISFSGKNEYFVYVYELTYKNFVQKYRSQANAVAFSNDNNFIFSAGDNGVIKRRSVNKSSAKKYSIWANNNWDSFFDIETTNKYFIAANRNKLIYVFDNQTGSRVSLLKGHTSELRTIAVSSNGKYLASAGKDRKIIIWNLNKFSITKVIQGGANSISSLAFSDNGNFMFLTYNDGSNRIWNLAKKGQMLTNNPPSTNFFQQNSFKEYSSISSFYNINPNKIFVINSLNKINRKTETIDYSVQKLDIWDIQNFGKHYFLKNNKKDIYKQYFISDTNSLIEVSYNATHSQNKSLWDNSIILDRQTVFSADVTVFSFSKKLKKNKLRTKDLYLKSNFTINGDVFFVNTDPSGEFLLDIKNDDNNGLVCDLWDLVFSQKISTILLDKMYDKGGFSPSGQYFYIASTSDTIIKIYETSSQNLLATVHGKTPLAFSDNELTFSYTDNYKNLYLYNLKQNTQIFKIPTNHQTEISDIKYNSPHNYIATTGYDGLIKFWDIKTGEALVSLAAFNNNDFIYISPDNYYYSTKGAMNYISFSLNNQLYTFEQFDVKFNRPDTVLSRLDYSTDDEIAVYYKAYKKRIKKMGFSNFDLNYNIPKVEITNLDSIPISTASNKLTLNFYTIDELYELDRINVWVNSVPIYGTNGISIKDLHKHEYSSSINIDLTSGKNKIDIAAVNVQGAESLKRSFSIICEDEAQPELYIISIGISDYKNSMFNLEYAAKDASDISSFFKNKNKLFSKVNTYEFLNEQATKDNILNIKNILLNTKVDDEVILFFAGHGTIDNDYNYFLTTYDFDYFDFENTVIKYDNFISIMDSIPARKKIIFIDACHSGEIDTDTDDDNNTTIATNSTPDTLANSNNRSLWAQQFGNVPTFGNSQNSFELMKMLFTDLRRGSGTTIISSAGGKEHAFESKDIKNGVFTYSLINGLKSKAADKNNDGKIMLSEIQDYVMTNVSLLTNGKQNPTNRRENLDYDFVLWK